MRDQVKRFVLIAILLLMLALVFLSPLRRKGQPRPTGVPTSALLGSAPDGAKLWIDCPSVSARRFQCSIYGPDGELQLAGPFLHAGFSNDRRVHFDGSKIYWRFGSVLRPLRLDCVRGGRPPVVPDCKN